MARISQDASGVGAGGELPARPDAPAALADLVPEQPRFFNFDAQAVRVVGKWDQPWFVARDVCAVLELERTDSAIRGLDDDEKGAHTVSTLGGPQQLSVVNESGLYCLIFRSRKEQARLFRRWVTNEVLPSIRRTGSYTAPRSRALHHGGTKELNIGQFKMGPVTHEDVLALFASPRSATNAFRYKGDMPISRSTFLRRVQQLREQGRLNRVEGGWVK